MLPYRFVIRLMPQINTLRGRNGPMLPFYYAGWSPHTEHPVRLGVNDITKADRYQTMAAAEAVARVMNDERTTPFGLQACATTA